MGHPSPERLQWMQSYYPILRNKKNFTCNTCHYAKHKRLPFSSSNSHALHSFDLLHIDMWGPCSKSSMHGHRYFLTIVDDYLRFTWIYLMHTKAETCQTVMNFYTYIETQFNRKVKAIKSDNGPEFLMHNFYASKGIIHQTSCIETPEQNGIVERKHQHLLNVTRALLFQASLPPNFWCYALPHATYLINCIPTPFYKTYHLMKNSMATHVIFLTFEFLVACVILTLLKHIDKSLIPERILASSLASNHILRDI